MRDSQLISFEVRFNSSQEPERTFPATAMFSDIGKYLRTVAGARAVTWSYQAEGFNIKFDGEHAGTITPTYGDSNGAKVEHLHKLFAHGGNRR